MTTVKALRLKQEEQAREKLQLEKVVIDGKMKKLEETIGVKEDTNTKALYLYIYYQICHLFVSC